MVFSINMELSLIFLALVPFLGIGLYFIMIKAYPLFRRIFKRYDDLNRVVEENVSGIRVVKSYVLEEEEKRKFQKVSKKIYKDFSKAEKILALNNPLMQFVIYASILLISWFGAKIIVNTGMTELTT
jgi:ATP-binding cassette subfamily B protein